MTRRYDKGVLVGEPDPPTDFDEWLRGEIAQAAKTDYIAVSKTGRPGRESYTSAYAEGRRQTLREVAMAYDRRAR